MKRRSPSWFGTRTPPRIVPDLEKVATAIARLETDDDGCWLVALGFEQHGGTVQLVDVHLFAEGRETFLDRPHHIGINESERTAQFYRNDEGWGRTTQLVAELRVDGPLPSGGITRRMVRGLPLLDFENAAREKLLTDERLQSVMPRTWTRDALKRPDRRGRPDKFYAQLAADYVKRLNAGSTRVVADIARARHLSHSTVRDLVSEARRRGLLNAAPRGRAGGALTDLGRQVLESKGH